MSQDINVKEAVSGATKSTDVENKTYEKDLWAGRITEIPSNMEGRWEYDVSNNCIYAGYAPKGLDEGVEGWLIHKFTWVSSNCTKREIDYGNWTAHTF